MLFVGLVSTITSQTNPHQIGSEYLRLFCELACVLCVFPTGLVTSGRLWLYQGQNRCASGGCPLVEMFGLVHPGPFSIARFVFERKSHPQKGIKPCPSLILALSEFVLALSCQDPPNSN